ncbi:MAG: ImmA/IrrE family metallo-endopeptidase [Actinomycetota bacterium]|nr:ImmA/IrrE family metallo-endopeptidase [Actinomycetota bacterium]
MEEAALREIEQRAERVLAGVPSWIWDGERLPVPIEDIADSCFGLLVRDLDELGDAPGAPALETGQSLSGLLLPDRGEIWVSASEGTAWPGRRRFTIGHELGHWCMHRAGDGAVFCRSTSIEPEAATTLDRPPPPPFEEEANVFAASLLMPAHLIQEHYELGCDFFGLCERFGASGAAMGRRLHAVVPRSA